MNCVFKYLVDSYFYQGWRYEYSSSRELIVNFAKDEKEDTVMGLISELVELRDNSSLSQDFISKLGGHFKPETEGLKVDEWIEITISILRQK